MVEVAVAAVAEPVAGHVDRRAEAAAVEQVRELVRLAVVEQRLGEREAAGVELVAEVVPVEIVDAVLEGGVDEHRPCNARGRRFVSVTGGGHAVASAAAKPIRESSLPGLRRFHERTGRSLMSGTGPGVL